MFGIGFGEMLLIAVLVLIAVGPDRLPSMLRTVAKGYRQFRRAADDLRSSTGLDEFLRDEELKELAELRKQKILALANKPPSPVSAAAVAGAVAAPSVEGATEGGAALPAGKAAFVGKPAFAGKPDVSGKPAAPSATGLPLSSVVLSYNQRRSESPPEGVDVAELRHAAAEAQRPVPAARPAVHGGGA